MKINHHSASSLIVPNDGSHRVLLGRYDSTYPVTCFRQHFVLIGGNAKHDVSPKYTFSREISEELETLGDVIDLNEEDDVLKTNLRDQVISRASSKGDWLVETEGNLIKRPSNLSYIVSAYAAQIDADLFNRLQKTFFDKKLLTEGDHVFLSYEDLKTRKVAGSWGHSSIISELLGIEIPEYEGIRARKIGKTKDSYAEYKREGFEYVKDPEL